MYMSSPPCASPEPGAREEKPLAGILKRVIKGIGGPARLTEEEMHAAWAAAAGSEAARHSRPVSFKKAAVFVNVDRSSWLYELTTRKKEILAKLEERLKGRKFRDIRFRIGDITTKSEKNEREESRGQG
jgi:predicted nucleic acid-binding Zn ribbon protein